ncbi:cytochrome c-type biogenesis protein CcmH [Stakelama sp. CBK3Z-3]|uniref:Cytochrome c-type biogenesis protein n=1 Tax=Stakelama flava TaxID=2860338 RepID=A0ABS6XH53_9SPHN|nr:cytochrome c-type biogenesis protein [Stakelama flava]MBW4329549.1 cytochrome c-type biogenesis protein CcmH [Stakelama flava]
MRGMLIALSLLAALGAPIPLTAQTADADRYAYSELPDPAQEAKAHDLMEELRCLVCQGQSIVDSDADMAADMRALVRERIANGEAPEAVRDWLIERYGDYVTYDPPLGWATAPLWFAPFLLLGAGVWLATRSFRRRRR